MWSVYLLIMIDTLFLSPSLHFTTLHSTSLHLSTLHFSPFELYPSVLHYTSLPSNLASPHLNFLPFHSPHITTLHLTSVHCNFRRFSRHFYSFRFIPLIIAFLTLFLKILDLKGKGLNASAGSWFQFLWSYLQRNISRYPFSASCP